MLSSIFKLCIFLVVLAEYNSLVESSRIKSFRKVAEDNSIELKVEREGKILLSGRLGLKFPEAIGNPTDCIHRNSSECFEYNDFARLEINEINAHCSKYEWSSKYAKQFTDCFDLLDGHHWYGGGTTLYQPWPIQTEARAEAPFVTGDYLQPGIVYGGVSEPYWLISTGISIQVDEAVPLFISWRSNKTREVCFMSKSEEPYSPRPQFTLGYRICANENIRNVHMNNYEYGNLVKPNQLPNENMLLGYFWSTWAQFKTNVTEQLVLEYAERILAEGFLKSSHMEIDDDWETCYGEAVFNPEKFPNPKQMTAKLKEMGFGVTLWVHPFINIDCPSFMEAVKGGYLVKDRKGNTGLTRWWQGEYAGIIDFTNPEGTDWWVKRLQNLQEQLNLDGYKFDAGETSYLPANPNLKTDAEFQPNSYTTKYVEAATVFGRLVEVRVARGNQEAPLFVRMLDKASIWGYYNGLRSLIPTLLQLSISGYPFVLPDMVGGNTPEILTKELYIRWIEANAFMPSLQLSIVPWKFGQEAVDITKKILELRESYKEVMLNAAFQATLDGSPINRPIWWIDPQDPVTFTIDSEYLLGDTILVAPVVFRGAVSRDVYLPKGNWTGSDGNIYVGPTWIRDFPAPLDVLPYFINNFPYANWFHEQDNEIKN